MPSDGSRGADAGRDPDAERVADAERVVDALLGPSPLPSLRALLPRLADPSLRAVVLAAERRLGVVRLDPDGDEARLLTAVSGRPGLAAAELAALTGLGARFAAAARALVEDGLVTSSRFERTDCWSRTARGAQALAVLRAD